MAFERAATRVTGRRFVAQFIDFVVLVPAGLAFDHLPFWAGWLANAVVLILYFGYLQGATGVTLGKLVCGIRVVNRHGKPPGVTAGVTRTLPLVFLMVWPYRTGCDDALTVAAADGRPLGGNLCSGPQGHIDGSAPSGTHFAR